MPISETFIQNILSNTKLAERHTLSDKVYEDEPILIKASQMANYTPPIYRKMREIALNNPTLPENVLFYKQAKFMESVEDDYEYNEPFLRYYPTYRALSDKQLRGYFSWRTRVRKGEIRKTSLSFVYIYIYELINGIGYTDPTDGFMKLCEFWSYYSTLDQRAELYMHRWLTDFCIYYDLPNDYLQQIPNATPKSDISVLLDYTNASDEAVFQAMMQLSSYHFDSSKFFLTHPKDCTFVTAEVFRALDRHYCKYEALHKRERFFGSYCEGTRSLFAGAVFYDHLRRKDYAYSIGSMQQYIQAGAQFRYSAFLPFTSKMQPIGAILKTVDSKMRIAYSFKQSVKDGNISDDWKKIIDECIDNYLLKKRFESAKRIEIDLSVLQGIRNDALLTQEKLLIEDQTEDEPYDHATEDVMENGKTQQSILSAVQILFIACLLENKDFDELLKENATVSSILADEINELLFDIFLDQVIFFDGDIPHIQEDYIDELKGYLNL